MTWTDTQWEGFAALLEEGWPTDFDDHARESWRILLDDLEPQVAVTALRRLLLEGRRFRPSVSELLAAARTDPSVPTFEEAFALIFKAAAFNGPERMRWLERHSPLVASFLQIQGPEYVWMLPVDDPDFGAVRRRELREAWGRFIETNERRQVAALAAGGRSGLRRLGPPPAQSERQIGVGQ